MANIKSAKKRVLVAAKKTAQNKAAKTHLKTVLKQANAAIEANAENKDEMVRLAMKNIDQACAKGLLHKNAAARKKSTICNLAK
ncbi:MAG: 30S ribosomal protein S20 [Oscillospiraceae bacterium]|nr:30S ribosomal protein S20 [Oscillospiraceae bacterium]